MEAKRHSKGINYTKRTGKAGKINDIF